MKQIKCEKCNSSLLKIYTMDTTHSIMIDCQDCGEMKEIEVIK